MGDRDFNQGRKDGADYQSDVNDHPWSTGAGLMPDPPHKGDNDDYNEGVKEGRESR